MNERIKELAEQAGLLGPTSRVGNAHEAAERFAELIRADERDKCAQDYLQNFVHAVEHEVLREREACAKLCDEYHYEIGGSCKDAAATIRARGEK